MIIEIDANWRIESDERCWMLRKRLKTPKEGRGRRGVTSVSAHETIGYYPTIGSAVNALSRRLGRDIPGTVTLLEAERAVEQIGERVQRALEPEYEVTKK